MMFSVFMLCLSQTVQAQTYEVETDNFLFVGDLDQARATRLVSDLEDYRSALLNALGLPYLIEPVKVKIFYAAHNRHFVDITGRQGAGGLYVRKLSGPLFVINGYDGRVEQNSLRKVAYHEFTHHLLETYYDGVLPMWYNEGLAEYYSSFTRGRDGKFVVGQPDHSNIALLKQYSWMPMQTLMQSVREYPFDSNRMATHGYSNVDFFYAQGWLAAHYFQSNSDARRKLQTYFSNYTPTLDGNYVFQQAFGMTYQQFGQHMREYLLKNDFKTRALTPVSPRTRRHLRAKRLSDAERALIVAEFTQSIDAPDMDEVKVDRLYSLAATTTSRAKVHMGRANLAESRGDSRAANAFMSGALRMAAGDPDISTQASVIVLKRNMGQSAMNTSEVLAARRRLKRAIELNSKNITAHYYYALSYAMLEDQPSSQALHSARKAVNYFRSSEFTEQNFYLTPIFLYYGDTEQAKKTIDQALVWSQSGAVKRDAWRLRSLLQRRSARY